MPTLIDSLVVELGLNAAKYSENLKKSLTELAKFKNDAEKHTKDIGKSAQSMTNNFKGLEVQLLKIATILMGGVGFTRFTADIIKSNANLQYMSKALGTSAKDLWAWQQVGKQVGATADEITSSWAGMNRAVNNYLQGQGQLNRTWGWFVNRGVRIANNGVVNNMTDVLLGFKRASIAAGLNPQDEATKYAQLGMSQGMINMMLQPLEKLRADLQRYRSMAPTAEQSKKAQEALAAFNDELARTESLGNKLAASSIVKMMNNLFTLILDVANDIEKFVEWLDEKSRSPFFKWLRSWGVPETGGTGPFDVPHYGGGAGGGGGGGGGEKAAPGPALKDIPQGSLKGINREWARKELAAKPYLRERLRRIVMAENPHPGAMSGVIESAMNRAEMQGISLEDALRTGAPYVRGAYYPHLGASPRGDLKKQIDEAIDYALAGSDVSHGAVDNSSGWLAAKHARTGEFDAVYKSHGETFQIPGTTGLRGGRAAYIRWKKRKLAEINAARKAAGDVRVAAPSSFERVLEGMMPGPTSAEAAPPRSTYSPLQPGINKAITSPLISQRQETEELSQRMRMPWGNNARAVPWLDLNIPGLIKGIQTTNTTNNSSTAETHIGSLTVNTEPRSNPWGIANQIKEAIEREGLVGESNSGPN